MPVINSAFAALSILVVDDDQTTRAMVTRMLTNMGMGSVYQAANGGDAVTLIRKEKPHVVICDIEMEPINGIEVLQQVRAGGQLRDRVLPFIFLTNRADSDVVTKARDLGVNAFLLKPVNPERLRERIQRVLDAQPRKP